MKIKMLFCTLLTLQSAWLPSNIQCEPLTIVHSNGKIETVQVEQTEGFHHVIDWLQNYLLSSNLQESAESSVKGTNVAHLPELNFSLSTAGLVVRAKTTLRNYDKPCTKSEAKSIRWIVKTLAWGSLKKIFSDRKEIEKEGDKLHNVHPLRFCEVIFSDDELRCGAYSIRSRTGIGSDTIKNNFFSGITTTLEEESKINNLTIAHIEDFARNVKVDAGQIAPLLQKGKWMDFVNYLIDTIPRENDPNRYNM